MALDSQNLMGRFNSLSRQPVTRQLGLLLGLAASIALGMGLVQWAMAPDFTPLYSELSPSATSDVIRSLENSGVPYKLHGSTGLVSVPADKVHEARLKLASEGLPQGDGSGGFDILYKEQELGVSSFMEKARYDRALEQELASSIASLDSIRSARVHLALPKQSAFVRKKNKPAASVLLSLYPARELTERQLAGIVHLVASSVPGLEAESVSVVDNQGKLLSSQSSNDDFAYTKEQFRFTQQLEQSYMDRITEILTPIVGVGSVSAQVAAQIDFTMVEKTSETYAPESTVRSEQLEEELSGSRKLNAGIPGTLSNQPPVETTVTDTPGGTEEEKAQMERSTKREVRNYELDKTISHIREVPGTLQKLSVAVVIDYIEQLNDNGESERVPLSEARLAEITSLVKEAVGFNETRGDSLNVINASFVAPPEMEPMPELSLMDQPWVWRAAKMGLSGIAIILVIFTVLRPLMQASSAPPPSAPPLAPPQGGYANSMGDGMGDDQVTLGGQQQLGLPGGAPGYQQQLNMARTMVEGEPERVAHVVKGWVAADG
ncbi:MAG: flagellar basal-body MS-ring/collar protein FliF [Porticoccus sp.]|nr:flagellar basal-body MS-ring/collar protein FliF [Porticoccus sp.]